MSLLILVVDDEPTILLSISYALEKLGYAVITAEDGKKALKIIEEYQPHLIITDITMPEMDGYELIRWVRQRPVFRLLPVIFLTVHTDIEERVRGYQLGVDAYLPKPFDLNELHAVIRNLLERSQLISQLIQWELRSRIQEQSLERLTFKSDTTNQSYLNKQEPTVQAITLHPTCLTDREKAVLKLLAEGRSNSQIASSLYLSPRTVEKYVSNLLCKTGTSNRVELVRFAMESHLMD